MARAELPITTLSRDGILLADATVETDGDPTDGHYVKLDDRPTLLFRNAGASTRTVTLAYGMTVDGQTVPARTIELTSGQMKGGGDWPESLFGQESGECKGCLTIDVDHADVKLQAIKQP